MPGSDTDLLHIPTDSGNLPDGVCKVRYFLNKTHPVLRWLYKDGYHCLSHNLRIRISCLQVFPPLHQALRKMSHIHRQMPVRIQRTALDKQRCLHFQRAICSAYRSPVLILSGKGPALPFCGTV